MKNGIIKEADFLRWPDEQQRLFTFRLLQDINADIKDLKRSKWVCQGSASFIGGIVGGIAAVLANFRFKIF